MSVILDRWLGKEFSKPREDQIKVSDDQYIDLIYGKSIEVDGETVTIEDGPFNVRPTEDFVERHYAPVHPGTGSGQEVHAGITTYPLAGDTVDGREVRGPIPNTSSIAASLMDWEELEGIREVLVSDFFEEGEQPYYYSVGKKESTMELAAALETSGWIDPLIVVIDREGAYILEGGHRLEALREIGAKSFPALVVVDREQIPEAVERGRIPAGIVRSIDEFMDSIAALFGIERQV